MKILEYQGPWKMTIEEAPIPEPAPDEVLLKTIAVGICGSDVHGFTGESGRRKPGVVMGHEAVGEIVSLGSGITSLKIGQRVATIPWLSCGHCKTCMKGLEHICPDKKHIGVNAGRWGAMAEYYIANVRQAFPISDSIDPDLGLFAEPLGVATHALNLMNPAPGDVTAIVGSGTIGLALTVALRDRGLTSIYILDKIDEKLAQAKRFGALPINIDKEAAADVIERETGNSRVPCVFEAVGGAATVRTAYDLCDFGGRVVLLGNLAKEFTLPLQGVISNEITLRGSGGFTRDDFGKAIEMVERNPDLVKEFVSGYCTLEETPEVMTALAKGERQAIKIIIKP
jgi:L-iditol 2-dehydrogenase